MVIPNNLQDVSIVGLGKLGGPIACAMASRGFNVVGIDVSDFFISSTNAGRAYLNEPDFAAFLKKYHHKFIATNDYSAILNSSITFIIVPTPSLVDGSFSNKFLVEVLQNIGKKLKQKKSFHLISIVSTISPESMQNILLPILVKYSGKTCGTGFGLCYNPLFVSLGNVIKNYLHPDFILIGQSDTKSGDILVKFYRKLLRNLPPVQRMNFINAEITKIALNTYVTTKISYANMLSELCENLPGANVDTVTQALGFDSRIGHKYLTGGAPYAGPCFPRDNRALSACAKKADINLELPSIIDRINHRQIKRLLKIITRHVPLSEAITILGLSYRPDTDVIDESAGMKLIAALIKNYHITVYDPKSYANIRKIFGNKIQYADSLKSSLFNARGIIITTNQTEFAKIDKNMLNELYPPFILDCWRLLNNKKLPEGIKYFAVGTNKSF